MYLLKFKARKFEKGALISYNYSFCETMEQAYIGGESQRSRSRRPCCEDKSVEYDRVSNNAAN
jgi:hypothetical protein